MNDDTKSPEIIAATNSPEIKLCCKPLEASKLCCEECTYEHAPQACICEVTYNGAELNTASIAETTSAVASGPLCGGGTRSAESIGYVSNMSNRAGANKKQRSDAGSSSEDFQ